MLVVDPRLSRTAEGDDVFSTRICQADPAEAQRVLYPHEELTAVYRWSGRASSQDCGRLGALAEPGPHLLTVSLGDVTSRPVALKILEEHAARMDREAACVAEVPLSPAAAQHGTFFAPRAYELKELDQLQREVFGPVLSIISFDTEADAVRIANDTIYGLAAGIWTKDLARAIRVPHPEGGTLEVTAPLPPHKASSSAGTVWPSVISTKSSLKMHAWYATLSSGR